MANRSDALAEMSVRIADTEVIAGLTMRASDELEARIAGRRLVHLGRQPGMA
jgi:hypothetical protein